MSHRDAGAVASEGDERAHTLDEATQWLEDDSAQRSVYSARVDLGFDEVNPQRGRQSNDHEDDGTTPVDPRERS
jgi:hypothetical protein